MPAISQLLVLLPKFLKVYFPFLLDWALQTLHKGHKLDPDTSTHPLFARAVFSKGLQRGVHKKVPMPFLSLQGPLKTQPFQFLDQMFRRHPKMSQNIRNFESDRPGHLRDEQQSPGAGRKEQEAARYPVKF